jgi:hypothetical protein
MSSVTFEPVKIRNIDVDALELRKRKDKQGVPANAFGKMFDIYHKNQKLEIVLPMMEAPFGASVGDKYGRKITLDLSFKGEEENVAIKRAHEKFVEIDEKFRELIAEKGQDIFKDYKTKKKTLTKEEMGDRYKSFIIPGDIAPDGSYYPDRIKFTIPFQKADDKKTEEEKAEIQNHLISKRGYPLFLNESGEPIPVTCDTIKETVPWKSRIKGVVTLAYMWYANSTQECRPVWYFTHGLLSVPNKGANFNILRDDDDEDMQESKENDMNEEVEDAEEGEEEYEETEMEA